MEIIDIRGQLPRNGTYLRRPLSKITKISVHWDAWYRQHEYDSVLRYKQEAQMHIDKDWGGGAHGDGIMYAYKIDNTGSVFQCRDHEDVLWNVGGEANYYTLAVCFDCGDGQQPTREQVEAFYDLMEELCFHHDEFPASQGDVFGHKYFNSTACPGTYEVVVNQYRNTRTVPKDNYSYDWPELQNNNTPSPKPDPVILPVVPEPTPVAPEPVKDPVITPAIDNKPVTPTPEVTPTVKGSPDNAHISQEMFKQYQTLLEKILFIVSKILNMLGIK